MQVQEHQAPTRVTRETVRRVPTTIRCKLGKDGREVDASLSRAPNGMRIHNQYNKLNVVVPEEVLRQAADAHDRSGWVHIPADDVSELYVGYGKLCRWLKHWSH